VLFGLRGAWFTLNDVTTGETRAYPELAPHRYAEPPDQVYAVMQRVAAGIPRWRVVREEAERRTLHVELKTALFDFTDDLTARVDPSENGSEVVIRSHSRVGRGDLGENARHIAALQARMDRELSRVGPAAAR
jgi:uncharacterized protein (DUF1499 family)